MNSKNILITGSGSGIGRAMAIRLASEGHNIILNGRTESKLVETETMLKVYDIKTMIKAGDVSNSAFVKSMISDIVSEWELLHVVINNAGISGDPASVIDISEEKMQKIMDINFKGTWLVSKFAAKIMKKQRKLKPISGKIINVSSIAGKNPWKLIGIYGCSKAAINVLTIIMAKELAPRITVNAICPGFHVTPIYKDNPNLIEDMMSIANLKPVLGRIGTAEDVSGLISFLVSEDSNYMTGQSINIDGGAVFH